MSRADQEEYRLNVMLCGDSNVGKSTFAQHFKSGVKFDHLILPPQVTVAQEVFYVSYELRACEGCPVVHIYLKDLPGGMQNNMALPLYARDADVFLFMYDLTQRATFENLRGRWREYRDKSCGVRLDETVTIVIGNKKDLLESEPCRAVAREEARQLARDCGAERCYEVSAKAKGELGHSSLCAALNEGLLLAIQKRRKAAESEPTNASEQEEKGGTQTRSGTSDTCCV